MKRHALRHLRLLRRDACRTPRVDNRPGLPALAYRIGTHAELHAARCSTALAAARHSRRLTHARSTDDPSMALLDAWATVADVLTFYQERIANEGFLRTATERRSVLELARAIGYELSPGVAASTYLAFKVDDPPPPPGQARTAGRASRARGHAGCRACRRRTSCRRRSRRAASRRPRRVERAPPAADAPAAAGARIAPALPRGARHRAGRGDRILITAPQTDGTGVDTQLVEIAVVATEPELQRTRVDLKELGKRAPDVKPPPPFKPTSSRHRSSTWSRSP